jgi:hypothetical protein
MKINYRLARLSPRLQVQLLGLLSPSTVPVAAPVLLGVGPTRAETVTPAQARERHGILPPTEAYAEFKELVASKVAAKAGRDEQALREEAFGASEPILGRVA